MTLSGFIQYRISEPVSVADNMITLAGMNPLDEYDPSDTVQRCAIYGVMLVHLDNKDAGVNSISEGGYSVSFNSEDKRRFMNRLAIESGCSNLVDAYGFGWVENKSNLW